MQIVRATRYGDCEITFTRESRSDQRSLAREYTADDKPMVQNPHNPNAPNRLTSSRKK